VCSRSLQASAADARPRAENRKLFHDNGKCECYPENSFDLDGYSCVHNFLLCVDVPIERELTLRVDLLALAVACGASLGPRLPLLLSSLLLHRRARSLTPFLPPLFAHRQWWRSAGKPAYYE